MKPIKIAKRTDLTNDEWLRVRGRGIGGSDAGAVLGLNPWKSPVELYLEKTGEFKPDDISGKDAVYFGNILEDTVAREFSRRTGLKVRNNNFILKHPTHEFMLGDLDREGSEIVSDGTKKRFVLECKTANAFKLKEWEEGVPIHYEAQVMHYLAITGYDYAYVACLVGGQKFFIHKIENDWNTLKLMIQMEKEFWENFVLQKKMPPIDGSVASEEILKSMFPTTTEGTTIQLNQHLDSLSKRVELVNQKKEIEGQIKAIDNLIKSEMEDNETGLCGDFKVSWKNVVSNRFNTSKFKKDHPELYANYVKPSNSRRFLISGGA